MKRFRIYLLPCVLIAGCTTPANPPSLLPRAIEAQTSMDKQPEPATQTPVVDAALMEKLSSFVADARAGDEDFLRAEQSGATALASGGSAPTGSEPWIAAQLTRSALQVARQRSAAALTEIDALAIAQSERASRDAKIGGLSEIRSAQAQVEAIVAAQTARLEALNR